MANMEEFDGRKGWIFSKIYTGAGAQESVNIRPEIRSSTIQLSAMDGTAKVEASIDGISWSEWPIGFVSTINIQGIVCAIKYIRVIHGTATTSKLDIWSVD
jgi:hypothetical protein